MDRAQIADAMRRIIEAIGEDPNRPGLKGTPERVADMYVELFAGVGRDPRETLSVVFEEGYDELVMVKDIPFYSLCEHHFVPFHGRAHVAYLPNDRGEITGLSKLARLVETVARRPQVQERLTSEIADIIMEVLDAKGSLVVIEAEHLCMSMRGIRKPGAVTVTSAVRGIFRSNPATRAEAMSLFRQGSL
ncbi:MAG: GTP cyclohydrolase I FolE [Acidimicrobiia bacterium]|nr:GTP cyclohydrolase I FolE [Acidimicrobiia bacterium]